MERLTKRELINGKHVGCNIEIGQMNSCPDCNDSCMYGTCKWQEKANQKLKEYEDLEEQGLLLKLPCRVGDDIYWIDAQRFINKSVINCIYVENGLDGIRIETLVCDLSLNELGETVFLTKSEAEKALAEKEK